MEAAAFYIRCEGVLIFVPAHLKNTGKLTEADARVKFQQMTAAVAYCHASGICHRDLKAENILLDANMNIKLAGWRLDKFRLAICAIKSKFGGFYRLWIQQLLYLRRHVKNLLWFSSVRFSRVISGA